MRGFNEMVTLHPERLRFGVFSFSEEAIMQDITLIGIDQCSAHLPLPKLAVTHRFQSQAASMPKLAG